MRVTVATTWVTLVIRQEERVVVTVMLVVVMCLVQEEQEEQEEQEQEMVEVERGQWEVALEEQDPVVLACALLLKYQMTRSSEEELIVHSCMCCCVCVCVCVCVGELIDIVV
jgi:hypothetical protein